MLVFEFGNMTKNYSWNMVYIFHESLKAKSRLKVHQIFGERLKADFLNVLKNLEVDFSF